VKDADEINLDELLDEQQKETQFATLEAIPDKPELFKITPWFPKRGCACQFALVIEKKNIQKLTRTGHRHPCCGKLLRVVEVEIKADSVMPLNEVLADLSRRASLQSPTRRAPAGRQQVARRRWTARSFRFQPLPIIIGDGPPTGWSGGDGDGDGDGDGYGDGYGNSQDYDECLDYCVSVCAQRKISGGMSPGQANRECEIECNGMCAHWMS
jgi:hypothetical protein